MAEAGFTELQASFHNPPADWLARALDYGKLCITHGATSEENLQLARQTVEFAREHGSALQLAVALTNLGCLQLGGQLQLAFDVLMEARNQLDVLEPTPEVQMEQRRVHNAIGGAYQALGDLEHAYLHFEQALHMARALQDRTFEARLLNNMGMLLLMQENHTGAAQLFETAEGLWRNLHNPLGLCRTLLNQTTLLLQQARKQQKVLSETHLRALNEALELLQLQANPILSGLALGQLAQLQLHLGQLEQANLSARQALEHAIRHDIFDIHMLALQVLAEIDMALGQPHKAIGQLLHIEQQLQAAGYLENQLEVLSELVQCYKATGQFAEALSCHERLHNLDREMRSAAASKQLELMASQRRLEQIQHEAELERIRSQELEQLVQERTRELEAAYLEMLERLAVAAEFRDGDTGEHTFRVGEQAAEVARQLGLPEERVRILRMAARLHDVGKIAVSDSILHKPGKLTPEEFSLMQTHTVAGARMLSQARSELIRMAETIALTHHEKWDGSGYPAGLAGESIPLEGRIVAVVDVLDALTSARPYKHAWTLQEALQEIQRLSGSHFDPRVVEALLLLYATPEEPTGD